MSKKDAVYYVGLIAGLIAGALVMRALGFGQLMQLLGSVVVGVGCGVLAEAAWSRRKPLD